MTEVLPQIETNTILCKTLTGLGATYSEIKAKRHSVIIVPNVPPIIGKCKDPKHKNDNLFGVKQGVTTEEVIDYIENLSAVLQVSEDTVFGNQAPLYVDACLKEIYPTLKFCGNGIPDTKAVIYVSGEAC